MSEIKVHGVCKKLVMMSKREQREMIYTERGLGSIGKRGSIIHRLEQIARIRYNILKPFISFSILCNIKL